MYEINETHDPNLKSWVESANDPNTDFPIQNLPYCMFGSDAIDDEIHIGVAIGDSILNLDGVFDDGLLNGTDREALGDGRLWSLLDGVMKFSSEQRGELRNRVSNILRVESDSAES